MLSPKINLNLNLNPLQPRILFKEFLYLTYHVFKSERVNKFGSIKLLSI